MAAGCGGFGGTRVLVGVVVLFLASGAVFLGGCRNDMEVGDDGSAEAAARGSQPIASVYEKAISFLPKHIGTKCAHKAHFIAAELARAGYATHQVAIKKCSSGLGELLPNWLSVVNSEFHLAAAIFPDPKNSTKRDLGSSMMLDPVLGGDEIITFTTWKNKMGLTGSDFNAIRLPGTEFFFARTSRFFAGAPYPSFDNSQERYFDMWGRILSASQSKCRQIVDIPSGQRFNLQTQDIRFHYSYLEDACGALYDDFDRDGGMSDEIQRRKTSFVARLAQTAGALTKANLVEWGEVNPKSRGFCCQQWLQPNFDAAVERAIPEKKHGCVKL